jgi:hypothetical protein
MRVPRLRATIKAKSPEEFERWRRLAEEVRQKKGNATHTTPTEAHK